MRSETTLASLAVHKAEREEKRYEEIRQKVAKQAPSPYVGQQHVKQTPPPKVGLPIHLRFRKKGKECAVLLSRFAPVYPVLFLYPVTARYQIWQTDMQISKD